MKRKGLALLLSAALCLLSACASAGKTEAPASPAGESASTAAPADGYEKLGGSWEVGGIYYRGKLIMLSENEVLAGLYDTTLLSFSEDGTFLYYNLFFHTGAYIEKDSDRFVLRTESVCTYSFTDGELVKDEKDSTNAASYLVRMLDDDSLQFDELDAATGNAAVDSNSLMFVRKEGDSRQENKASMGDLTGKDNENRPASTESTIPPSTLPPSTVPASTTPKTKDTNVTHGMKNALDSAKSYLSIMPFSYSGLVGQLEYEGYTNAEATYAADNCGADWYKQAAKAAKQYLDIMSFSRSGLIDQLEYEGYTHDEAVYGVNQAY